MRKNLLHSRRGRFLSFGLMYISEGIPLGFTSIAMVAFMRRADLTLEQIGIASAALYLPWAFKWLIAPLIDLIRLHRYGGKKAWILFCTTMMIVTLLLTAALDLSADFELLLAVLVLNNIFCATQDVAIDALAISTLEEDERGRANGFMFGGQYVGIALGGGAAIFVYGAWGFDASLMYVSFALFLNLLFIVFFVKDPSVIATSKSAQPNILQRFFNELRVFCIDLYKSFLKSGRSPKLGLLYSLLPFAPFALGYATLSTIQIDYGLSDNQTAELTTYATIASGIGCLIGGFLGDKFGIRKILGTACVACAVPTLLLASQIASVGLEAVNADFFYANIVAYSLLFGMAFALSVAVFMGMTNPIVAATQFTAFMGVKNLTISYTNYWQGVVAEKMDYSVVLYIDSVIFLLPLAILPFLKTRKEEGLDLVAVNP
jgi:PAT family beta-lactamase induction signal transducer AmpG